MTRQWVGSETPCNKTYTTPFDACTKNYIGKSQFCQFWSSQWLDGVAPAYIAPSLFKLTRIKRLSVEQALVNDKWMTGLHRVLIL
jgi:hypothetical protein